MDTAERVRCPASYTAIHAIQMQSSRPQKQPRHIACQWPAHAVRTRSIIMFTQGPGRQKSGRVRVICERDLLKHRLTEGCAKMLCTKHVKISRYLPPAAATWQRRDERLREDER